MNNKENLKKINRRRRREKEKAKTVGNRFNHRVVHPDRIGGASRNGWRYLAQYL